jgi:predicted small secreted protein
MNSSPKAAVLILIALALALFTTTGCQTSKGLGKDVEKLGEKIQDKAK